MKRSIFSVSTLVISISMVAMLLCGTIAKAETIGKFFYDKKENVEIVFTADKSGRYLTRKLKYEYERDENNSIISKKAYRWDASLEQWSPYYLMEFTENENEIVVNYAQWNVKEESFSANMQKAVYEKQAGQELTAYTSYRWNETIMDWEVDHQILPQNYLAGSVNLK